MLAGGIGLQKGHNMPTKEEIFSFLNEMWVAARNRVVRFIKDLYEHTEAIGILVLASLGLNALLGEIPFYFTLPLWIEAPMVIPVLAVIGIAMLVRSSEWRAKRRAAHV